MIFLCSKIPLFYTKIWGTRSVRYVRYHYVHPTYCCVCCKTKGPKFPVKSRNFGLFLRSKPLQVPSSAPGKARFFGLFSFFTLVRLVRMCKIVVLSVKYEFYIHGSGTWLSAEGEISSPPTFCK